MVEATEIDKLRQVIDALETQRAVMGDAVVDAALAPIREKLASLQSAAQRESRKLVTVLFADLVDHTTLFNRLDPEDVHEILDAYFAAWRGCIERQGGLVEKFIGDAVMAVFGEPAAQEDDAERAIRAALEMRQKWEAWNEGFELERGVRLAMRVGINTGEVVSSVLGERQGEEFVVVGETVNLASRLQGAAPVGGILIAHATYRQVRGVFNVRRMEPIQVKGVAEPIQVYLALEAKPRAFRLASRGVEGVETRMVGRESELKRLQDAFWEVVEEGERQVITIVGEAGIGKSRLMYEFDNWLELLPQRVYYFKGRAFLAMQNSPYSLLRSAFAFRFNIHESDTPDAVWAKLEQGVGQALGGKGNAPAGYQRQVYYIGRLLGFELGEALPGWDEGANSGAHAAAFHDQALVYLGQFFQALARLNPVVVLLEDIHWADDSSLELVHRLESFQARQPLLIVCTARRGLFVRRPNWAEGLPYHTRLALEPLTKRESRLLVEEILRKASSIPDELLGLVAGRADGNPFYIEEGIKILIEEGAIEKTGEQWRVNLDQVREVKIPHTLLGLLQARLDGLDVRQRTLLQRAAVVGRIFWDEAVVFLGQSGEAQEGEDLPAAQELLGELRSREIIYWRERSSFENTREYLFRHSLLRDVAYESLLKRRRRAYHARTARWLEQATRRSRRTDEYAALIALHYEQAGEGEQASAWYTRSGRLAAVKFANAEAVHAFSRALELSPAEDVSGRFEILLAREQVLHLQGDRPRQQADLEALAELAEALGEAARAQAALRQADFHYATSTYPAAIASAQTAIGLAGGAAELEAQGYYLWARAVDNQAGGADALALFQKALALARLAGAARLEADILMSLGPHFSDLSQYEQARSHLESALALYRQLGDRTGEARALGNLGVTYWGQSDYEQAKAHFEASLAVVRETGDRRVEGILLGNLGVIAHEVLNYAESAHFHRQALEISQEILDRYAEFIHLGNLAEAARDLGDFEQAQALYAEALQAAGQVGSQAGLNLITVSLSLLLEYQGDYAGSLEKAEQALELARARNRDLYTAVSLARLGQALLGMGRRVEAQAYFEQALEQLSSLGMESRAMEIRAGLARVRLAEGDAPGALAQAEAALEYFGANRLYGTEEPARIYLTCCQALMAVGDPRAGEVLQNGYTFLQAQAAQIESEAERQAFLERIPHHRELMALWRSNHS